MSDNRERTDAESGSGVLGKAMLILEGIAATGGTARVSDLAAETRLPLGTLHRLISGLVRERLLRRDPAARTYGLGRRLLELAYSAGENVNVGVAVLPAELARLREITGETVALVGFEGGNAVYLSKADGRGVLRTSITIGDKAPFHASAAGKAVLAFAETQQQISLLAGVEFERFTAATLGSLGELDCELRRIRTVGYAVENEEHVPGIRSIAAPILDVCGNAVGALAIIGPAVALDASRIEGFATELCDAATRASVRLGANPREVSVRPAKAADHEPITCAFRIPAAFGTSPVWSARHQALFWIDITAPAVYAFDPATQTNRTYPLEEIVGGVTLWGDGHVVIATQTGFQKLDLASGASTHLASPRSNAITHRFNKGACDRKGRLWSNNMAFDAVPGAGNLFRLDPDFGVHVMDTGFTHPNAIAWNPDDTLMYMIDSSERAIYAYDFDLEKGEIANRQTFIKVPPDLGRPNGLAVDVDGFLWSPHADGWRLTRYTPDGKVDAVFSLPVPRGNGCAFGGPDMKTLYVTTARERLSVRRIAEAPLAGSLFAYAAPVAGLSAFPFGGAA